MGSYLWGPSVWRPSLWLRLKNPGLFSFFVPVRMTRVLRSVGRGHYPHQRQLFGELWWNLKVRKPPGLGRTYHHGTFHRVVWCCTGAEEERYLDLTLLNLSLDEPPTKGTRELEEQERARGRERQSGHLGGSSRKATTWMWTSSSSSSFFLPGESAVGARNGPFQSSFWLIDCLVVLGHHSICFGQFDNNTYNFSKS